MATLRQQLEIPKTNTRLKSLIKCFVSFGGYDPSQGIPALSGLQFLSALTKVEFPVNRGAVERRELNFDNLGKILEMVPGLVDFDGARMTYIWQYQASFLEACGFGGHTLEFQTRPLLFLLQLPSPNPDVVPEKNILLLDCWLKKNPAEFSVEDKDDLRIRQEVDIAVGGIIEA
jgi:hypothetical protein